MKKGPEERDDKFVTRFKCYTSGDGGENGVCTGAQKVLYVYATCT